MVNPTPTTISIMPTSLLILDLKANINSIFAEQVMEILYVRASYNQFSTIIKKYVIKMVTLNLN